MSGWSRKIKTIHKFIHGCTYKVRRKVVPRWWSRHKASRRTRKGSGGTCALTIQASTPSVRDDFYFHQGSSVALSRREPKNPEPSYCCVPICKAFRLEDSPHTTFCDFYLFFWSRPFTALSTCGTWRREPLASSPSSSRGSSAVARLRILVLPRQRTQILPDEGDWPVFATKLSGLISLQSLP